MSNKPNATLAWAGDELQCNGVTVAQLRQMDARWYVNILGLGNPFRDRADAAVQAMQEPTP